MNEDLEEPTLEGWQELNVYKLNSEQIWLAGRLKDAIDGAALAYGQEPQELMDELCPPQRVGQLGRLVKGKGLSPLEQEVGEVAVRQLRDGFTPPLILGVLSK